jgi:hypothetical protein
VWILFLHFREKSTCPVPLWAKRLFLIKLRFILCDKAKLQNLETETEKVCVYVFLVEFGVLMISVYFLIGSGVMGGWL